MKSATSAVLDGPLEDALIEDAPRKSASLSKRLVLVAAGIFAVLALVVAVASQRQLAIDTIHKYMDPPPEPEAPGPRYAFATFLSGFKDKDTLWGDRYKGDSQYFDGTRLINCTSARMRPCIVNLADMAFQISYSIIQAREATPRSPSSRSSRPTYHSTSATSSRPRAP